MADEIIIKDYIDEQNEIFTRRFESVDKRIVESEIFKLTSAAFAENMKNWQITPAQQAMAWADFMSKTAIGFISVSTETALKMGISLEQEESEKAKRSKELELANEQINKTNHEKEMLAEQVLMLKTQTKSEEYRAFSLKLDSEMKKQQVALAKINALSEAQKINILIKTANDNLELKQAELLVEYLKTLSTDEDVKLTDNNVHHTILSKIEQLNKSKAASAEQQIKDILNKMPEIKNLELDESKNAGNKPLIANIVFSNEHPLINENVGVALISNTSLDDKIITFACENESKTGKNANFKFTSAGEKIINVSVKDGAQKLLYENAVRIVVKELK